jgi:hypothetical protein
MHGDVDAVKQLANSLDDAAAETECLRNNEKPQPLAIVHSVSKQGELATLDAQSHASEPY